MCLLQGVLQHNEREGKELFQGNKTGKLRQGQFWLRINRSRNIEQHI